MEFRVALQIPSMDKKVVLSILSPKEPLIDIILVLLVVDACLLTLDPVKIGIGFFNILQELSKCFGVDRVVGERVIGRHAERRFWTGMIICTWKK